MKQRRSGRASMRVVVGILVLVALFLGLVAVAYRGSGALYVDVSELLRDKQAITGQRVRVRGLAQAIQWKSKPMLFRLEWAGASVVVRYVGSQALPDTFEDGVEAVAEGFLEKDGILAADRIQAKCGSKYEADPSRARPAAGSG